MRHQTHQMVVFVRHSREEHPRRPLVRQAHAPARCRIGVTAGSRSAGSHGRYPLAPILRAVDFEADQAARVLTDPDVVVVPIVAVHGAQVPWGKVVMDGVPVMAGRRLPSMLRQLPAVLGPERVAALTSQARIRFHTAA
jgi:hypothetical protein